MSEVKTNTDQDSPAIQPVELGELPVNNERKPPLLEGNIEVIKNVRVNLEVVVGATELAVSELYKLQEDSVIKLDRDVEEPVDLVLDGRVIARGMLVVAGDKFGIRITEVNA